MNQGSAFIGGLSPFGCPASAVKLLFLQVVFSLISCAPSWPRAVGPKPWSCEWRPCSGGPEHCCTAQHSHTITNHARRNSELHYQSGEWRQDIEHATLFPLCTRTVLPHSCFYVMPVFIGCGVCTHADLSVHLSLHRGEYSKPWVHTLHIILQRYPSFILSKNIYFNKWLQAPGNGWTLWWPGSCWRSISWLVGSVPGDSPAARLWSGCCSSQVLGTAQPQWWQRGRSTISPHGSQSSLNITSYKGLFELTGCWTHSPFQKGVKQKSDAESDREYVNNKWMRYRRIKRSWAKEAGQTKQQGKNTVKKWFTCCIRKTSPGQQSFSLTMTPYSMCQLSAQWIPSLFRSGKQMQWLENYFPVTFVSLKSKVNLEGLFFSPQTEHNGRIWPSLSLCCTCLWPLCELEGVHPFWGDHVHPGGHMSILEGTLPSHFWLRLSKSPSLSCWQPTTHSCLMQVTYNFHVSNAIFVKGLRIFLLFCIIGRRKKFFISLLFLILGWKVFSGCLRTSRF